MHCWQKSIAILNIHARTHMRRFGGFLVLNMCTFHICSSYYSRMEKGCRSFSVFALIHYISDVASKPLQLVALSSHFLPSVQCLVVAVCIAGPNTSHEACLTKRGGQARSGTTVSRGKSPVRRAVVLSYMRRCIQLASTSPISNLENILYAEWPNSNNNTNRIKAKESNNNKMHRSSSG